MSRRCAFVRCAALATTAWLASCGGEGGTSAPPETFPDVAGVYTISGGVDGGGSINGTITLTQASLSSGTLGGFGSVTGTYLDNLVVTVTADPMAGTISPAGVISFNLVDENGTWSFTNGTFSGNSIHGGRQTLRIP